MTASPVLTRERCPVCGSALCVDLQRKAAGQASAQAGLRARSFADPARFGALAYEPICETTRRPLPVAGNSRPSDTPRRRGRANQSGLNIPDGE